VEDELWEIWKFIAWDNPDAATQVIDAARASFRILAENPSIGIKRRLRNKRLHEIRSWPVSGFANYVIFYRPLADGIMVLHLYHGARDIDALFDQE